MSVQWMVCGKLTSHFSEVGGEDEEAVWKLGGVVLEKMSLIILIGNTW